jgi:hypothetical protein
MTGEPRNDDLLDAIARELRTPVEPVPGAVERIARAAREAGEGRHSGHRHGTGARRGVWAWFTGRGAAVLAPVGAAVAVVLLAAALTGVFVEGGRGRGRTGPEEVQFVLVAPGASRVALVGDFNDWDPDTTPLRQADDGHMWTVELPLAPGRHTYAFVVDGNRWVQDESAPLAPEDEFGVRNSVVLVEAGT